MIEVLFGESEAGSMKFSKSKSNIRKADGSTSFISNSLYSESEKTKFISGNSNEVICLGFMLDIGDIKKPVNSDYRQNLIFSMYTQSGWDNRPDILEDLKMTGSRYNAELKHLTRFLKNAEAIRIWYSDCPYSLCGFYYLCSMLNDYTNDIFTVKLPRYIKMPENQIKEQTSWSEVPAEKFSDYLKYEEKLTAMELKIFAHKWCELVEDNSPLRAVVNGKLIGVQEDFYDFLIQKHITYNPIKEARILGTILGNYPLGIGDWWYAYRIEVMINNESIQVIEDSAKKYTRVLRKI